MSVAIQIFVGFKSPLFKNFCQEIEAILGLDFRFMPDSGGNDCFDYYVFADEHRRITLSETGEGFENDRDMNFGDYQHYIGVQAIGWRYEEEHDRILNESSRAIFEKLKAAGRYPLMMIYDMQRKLDEFQPKQNEAISS